MGEVKENESKIKEPMAKSNNLREKVTFCLSHYNRMLGIQIFHNSFNEKKGKTKKQLKFYRKIRQLYVHLINESEVYKRIATVGGAIQTVNSPMRNTITPGSAAQTRHKIIVVPK